MNNTGHLLVRHFFYELHADLGLSNATHSPEETGAPWYQATSSTREKNVPNLVKYIFPSSKERTRVWWLKYRDCLPFSRMNVDNIGVAVNLYNHYQIVYTTYSKTYKSAVGDKYILGIRKTTQPRTLIPLIISSSQGTWLEATNRKIIRYVTMRKRQCVAMFFHAGHRSNVIDHQSRNARLINDGKLLQYN